MPSSDLIEISLVPKLISFSLSAKIYVLFCEPLDLSSVKLALLNLEFLNRYAILWSDFSPKVIGVVTVSYTHLRAHET